MENIEIKKAKNKRSIESLIEESAIDNSFNYQAHELRKAFNETLMNMNVKTQERQKEIEKLKIIIKEYEQIKTKYEVKFRRMQEELNTKTTQLQQIAKHYKENKKKMQYLEYKIQNITENRNIFNQDDSFQNQEKGIDKKKLKSQICEEFTKVISKKIDYFTRQIKKYSMSFEVQSKMESFLQQLIYLNPYSEIQLSQKTENRANNLGKIKKEEKNITGGSEWMMLQKSLQKLKKVHNERSPFIDRKEMENKNDRSISTHKRRKLFNN